MDISNLHPISNSYQDSRLISLKSWKRANEISPRDQGGPYMISQEGYDPADLMSRPDEFLLGRTGKWTSIGIFFKLPVDVRRAEYVFGTAAEVMSLLDSLPPGVQIQRGDAVDEAAEEKHDDLHAAYHQAKQQASDK